MHKKIVWFGAAGIALLALIATIAYGEVTTMTGSRFLAKIAKQMFNETDELLTLNKMVLTKQVTTVTAGGTVTIPIVTNGVLNIVLLPTFVSIDGTNVMSGISVASATFTPQTVSAVPVTVAVTNGAGLMTNVVVSVTP